MGLISCLQSTAHLLQAQAVEAELKKQGALFCVICNLNLETRISNAVHQKKKNKPKTQAFNAVFDLYTLFYFLQIPM